MKKLILTTVLFTFLNTYAQEIVLSFQNDLKTTSSHNKDVIPIVNTENSNQAFFIADAKNVYGYLFDENFKLISKLKSSEKKRKFKNILGYSILNAKEYCVYLSNNNKKEFAVSKFSFEDKKEYLKEFKLEKNEKFVEAISYNNKFYLITSIYDKGELYISTSDENNAIKKNKIDLSKVTFLSDKGFRTYVVRLLNPKTNLFVPPSSFTKIEANTPSSIEYVLNPIKLYTLNDKIIFSFDHYKKETQVLEIDVNTFEAIQKKFPKPLASIAEVSKKTNSFIFKDKVFTITATRETGIIEVLDYANKDLLKQWVIKKEKPITFKNTPIIQKGGYYEKHREFEKTKKFLRKISTEKIGISVIEQNGNYIVTSGGAVIQSNSTMHHFGANSLGGIPLGSIGNVSVSFNPISLAYNSFSNTKSTYIKSIFDKSFNHIQGKIPPNIFNKIKDYTPESYESILTKDNDNYYQILFKFDDNRFFIKKFTN